VLNDRFCESIGAKRWPSGAEGWFCKLISFLALSATQFSTLRLIGKMKISALLTVGLS